MRKKYVVISAGLICALWLAGCAAGSAPVTETSAGQESEPPAAETTADTESTESTASEESAPSETVASEETASENSLVEAAALLGMADAKIAELFDGGKENWTEDRSFYIGRIFETELCGEPVTIHALCDTDEAKTVNAVSIWIADGSAEVTEEQLAFWQEQVSAFTGTEMEDRGVAKESGSHSWIWKADGTFYTMHLLDNILTLSFNPAVGELR